MHTRRELYLCMDFLREIVSGPKNRFRENGYNLDLTYICPRLIAMSFPASGVESVYRNPIDNVNEKEGVYFIIIHKSAMAFRGVTLFMIILDYFISYFHKKRWRNSLRKSMPTTISCLISVEECIITQNFKIKYSIFNGKITIHHPYIRSFKYARKYKYFFLVNNTFNTKLNSLFICVFLLLYSQYISRCF